MQTSFEGFAVFFAVLIFSGLRETGVWLCATLWQDCWSCNPIAERVSKEIFLVVTVGGAPVPVRGGRAVLRKSKTYDCTKGFQGEDVLQ